MLRPTTSAWLEHAHKTNLFSSARLTTVSNRFTPFQFFQQDNCFYIVHSLETEEQTPNLTVVTQAVHCRKQAPLIKVLFCDHSLTAFSSEAVGNSTIVAKFKEVLIPRMTKNQSSPMIQSTKQVSRIFAGNTAVLFVRSSMRSQRNPHWEDERERKGETVNFYVSVWRLRFQSLFAFFTLRRL